MITSEQQDQGETAQKRECFEQLQVSCNILMANLRRSERRVHRWQKRCQVLEVSNHSLMDELENAKNKMAQWQRDFEQLQVSCDALTIDLGQADNEILQLQRKYQTLEASNEKLNRVLKAAGRQLKTEQVIVLKRIPAWLTVGLMLLSTSIGVVIGSVVLTDNQSGKPVDPVSR
ncbi:MAG: hypothetical protein ACFCU8_15930 [Thermosynechococcaceae cyanobacterium]